MKYLDICEHSRFMGINNVLYVKEMFANYNSIIYRADSGTI